MIDRQPAALLGVPYLRFTDDHDPVDAEARFVERYGCKPRYTWVTQRQLWLGPCPEGKVE